MTLRALDYGNYGIFLIMTLNYRNYGIFLIITLNYGNYGRFLIMGNAGFCPSAVHCFRACEGRVDNKDPRAGNIQ